MPLPWVYAPGTSPVGVLTTVTRSPAARASASVRPTAHTCGSVNVTRGTMPWEATSATSCAQDRRGGDPAVVLAHVGEQREPVAVADRVQPAPGNTDRPQPLVHLDRAPGLQPDVLEAEVGGRGPAADRDQDLVAGELPPVRHCATTGPSRPRRRAAVIRTPVTTVMPSASNAARSSSPANGSSRASSRSAPSRTTTSSQPSRLNACAISAPTAPPPSTSSRRGTSLALVIARLSQGLASAQPGDRGDERAGCRWPAPPPAPR